MDDYIGKLGKFCTIASGSTPKSNVRDGDICWVTSDDIDGKTRVILNSKRKVTKAVVEREGLKLFPAGTVFLSLKAPAEKVAIAGSEMCCGQDVVGITCSCFVDKYYLYWYLKVKVDFNSLGLGNTVKELTEEIVNNIDIPVKTLKYQQYIGETLNIVEDTIDLRREEFSLINDTINAKYAEIFGDPVKNDKGWPLVSLGDVSEILTGPSDSLLHKEDHIENGHAIVEPANIVDGRIVVDTKATVSDEKFNELSSYALHPNDIALGRCGETLRCAVVRKDGLLCGTGCVVIRPNGKLLPKVLQAILSNPGHKDILVDISTLSSLKIPLLPMDEQNQYVSFAKKLGTQRMASLRGIDKLKNMKQALIKDYWGGKQIVARRFYP